MLSEGGGGPYSQVDPNVSASERYLSTIGSDEVDSNVSASELYLSTIGSDEVAYVAGYVLRTCLPMNTATT